MKKEELLEQFKKDRALHLTSHQTSLNEFAELIEKYSELTDFDIRDEGSEDKRQNYNPLVWIITYSRNDLFKFLVDSNLLDKLCIEKNKEWIIHVLIERNEILLNYCIEKKIFKEQDVINEMNHVCLHSQKSIFEKYKNKVDFSDRKFLKSSIEGLFINGIEETFNHKYKSYDFIDISLIRDVLETSFANNIKNTIPVLNILNKHKDIKLELNNNITNFLNKEFTNIYIYDKGFYFILDALGVKVFENHKFMRNTFKNLNENSFLKFINDYPNEVIKFCEDKKNINITKISGNYDVLTKFLEYHKLNSSLSVKDEKQHNKSKL